MSENIRINRWLSRIGLALIFFYSFLASIFYSTFAKIHVCIHAVPFPVFLSEILLVVCLLLFLIVCENSSLFTPRIVLLLSLYFGWVFIKALVNYVHDGPLTCRNAALFYYPIFGVFTYCFYSKAEIPSNALKFLAWFVIGVLLLRAMVFYYWWTYVVLLGIAIWNIKSKPWRWMGWLLLGGLLFLYRNYFYQGSRSHEVSAFASLFFLLFYFGWMLIKQKKFFWVSIPAFIGLMFVLGFFILSNHNTVTSLTSVKGVMQSYQQMDKDYRKLEPSFVPKPLPVHLYNPMVSSRQVVNVPIASPPDNIKVEPLSKIFESSLLKTMSAVEDSNKRIDENRPLDVDENNMVFRLFVWRDMAWELIEKKAWFGFSFGHPQRSKSLEVLHWAESEWSRDGWITPHNSFIHVIYRSGILGVGFISLLFFVGWKLTGDFFRMSSIEGALLLAILVYWMVLSNFLVILEFPYNAILIWTVFGITCAYRHQLLMQKEKVS